MFWILLLEEKIGRMMKRCTRVGKRFLAIKCPGMTKRVRNCLVCLHRATESFFLAEPPPETWRGWQPCRPLAKNGANREYTLGALREKCLPLENFHTKPKKSEKTLRYPLPHLTSMQNIINQYFHLIGFLSIFIWGCIFLFWLREDFLEFVETTPHFFHT